MNRFSTEEEIMAAKRFAKSQITRAANASLKEATSDKDREAILKEADKRRDEVEAEYATYLAEFLNKQYISTEGVSNMSTQNIKETNTEGIDEATVMEEILQGASESVPLTKKFAASLKSAFKPTKRKVAYLLGLAIAFAGGAAAYRAYFLHDVVEIVDVDENDSDNSESLE